MPLQHLVVAAAYRFNPHIHKEVMVLKPSPHPRKDLDLKGWVNTLIGAGHLALAIYLATR